MEMFYYKDPETGEIYAYDSQQVSDNLVKEGLEPLSQEEVEALLNPPKTPIYKTQLSVLEFRDRFTQEEKLAIRQAQLVDMEVGILYDDLQAASFVDLEDPRVGSGLDLYISKGLLDPKRKDELLAPELVE